MEDAQATRGVTSTLGRSRALKGMLVPAGALFAGYLWLLLYVILAVPLWVSFIAAGVTFAVYAGAALTLIARGFGHATQPDPRRGDIVVGDDGVLLNPLVNVGALRLRFVLSLSLMFLAGWLIVETLAFSTAAQRPISFAFGIVAAVFGAASYLAYRRLPRDRKQSIVIPSIGRRFALWQALGALVTAIGAWQIVETLVFSNVQTRWLTFENAIVFLALAVVGLVVHEFSTEHVVHVLEVAGWRPRRRADEREAARPAA